MIVGGLIGGIASSILADYFMDKKSYVLECYEKLPEVIVEK